MGSVKTLAHKWATEIEAMQGQQQVDTALGFPNGETLHYQSIQEQEDFWWMMADGTTANVLGFENLEVIDEEVQD
jgi:hypothetical protein